MIDITVNILLLHYFGINILGLEDGTIVKGVGFGATGAAVCGELVFTTQYYRICDGEDVLIGAIMEHIEEAGIHSGDAGGEPPQ